VVVVVVAAAVVVCGSGGCDDMIGVALWWCVDHDTSR
jgi:hypothetical protein